MRHKSRRQFGPTSSRRTGFCARQGASGRGKEHWHEGDVVVARWARMQKSLSCRRRQARSKPPVASKISRWKPSVPPAVGQHDLPRSVAALRDEAVERLAQGCLAIPAGDDNADSKLPMHSLIIPAISAAPGKLVRFCQTSARPAYPDKGVLGRNEARPHGERLNHITEVTRTPAHCDAWPGDARSDEPCPRLR